jgi:hypothetical protein
MVFYNKSNLIFNLHNAYGNKWLSPSALKKITAFAEHANKLLAHAVHKLKNHQNFLALLVHAAHTVTNCKLMREIFVQRTRIFRAFAKNTKCRISGPSLNFYIPVPKF